MYRKTYANVYLNNIKNNVNKIIEKYNNYKYYIGVVKADSYGHNGYEVVKFIIDGGCNYLAVSSLDEALEIREYFDIPILCLGIINSKYISICEENNIDITVTNLDYLKEIKDRNINIHIKIDTGMNRLGVKEKKEFNSMIELIKESDLKLKGIYTHIYNASNKGAVDKQINVFKNITSDVDLNKIDIVHIAQSDTLVNYPKIDFCNGCRLGIIMYGLTNNDLELKNTIELVSEIIEIKKIKKGDTVSYNGTYEASEDEIIGIVSIGYADGVNRHLKGSYVYINNKKYEIIGNICMDICMVDVTDAVCNVGDKVEIFGENIPVTQIASQLDTIPYEILTSISQRVKRVYYRE